MRTSSDILAALRLPKRDAYDLPTSRKRFADGGGYRIEIPSCEGPRAMEAVVAASHEHDVPVHRVSQGSGVMLQTDEEIGRMLALGRQHFYVEAPDDFGGTVRHYEVPELVRIAAPIYLKFGLRNAPGIYPSGQHIENTVVLLSRERVRRAALALAILRRVAPDATASPLPARV